MNTMPTVVVPEAGHDKTRGFMVINRPYARRVRARILTRRARERQAISPAPPLVP